MFVAGDEDAVVAGSARNEGRRGEWKKRRSFRVICRIRNRVAFQWRSHWCGTTPMLTRERCLVNSEIVCGVFVSPEMPFRTCDYCVTISSIALLFLLASNQIPAKVLHTRLDCMESDLDIDWD